MVSNVGLRVQDRVYIDTMHHMRDDPTFWFSHSDTGDPNFTRPTAENAIEYKKMSETFQKLSFDEATFLRCGCVYELCRWCRVAQHLQGLTERSSLMRRRESAAFPLAETADDATQRAMARNEVNAQCLHCLNRGCGYCFVANNLRGDSQQENTYPGEVERENAGMIMFAMCVMCRQRSEPRY